MITIDKEKFSESLSQELLPLAQKCWDERTLEKGETCAFYGSRDTPIDPDTEKYLSLGDALMVVTVRDDGVLKGYAIVVTHKSMHMKKVLCGFVDCIYMEPAYQAYAGPTVERFEKEAKDLGVEIIGWPVHVNGPVYKVAQAMGYVGDDIVMERRI